MSFYGSQFSYENELSLWCAAVMFPPCPYSSVYIPYSKLDATLDARTP